MEAERGGPLVLRGCTQRSKTIFCGAAAQTAVSGRHLLVGSAGGAGAHFIMGGGARLTVSAPEPPELKHDTQD